MERRLKEALEIDDRIEAVKDFTMVFKGEYIVITFTASTIFGDIPIERG